MRKDHAATAVAAISAMALAVAIPLTIPSDGGEWSAADPLEQARCRRVGNPEVPPAVVTSRVIIEGILGKEVRSAAGENMGRIGDVWLIQAGRCVPLSSIRRFPRRRQSQDCGGLGAR